MCCACVCGRTDRPAGIVDKIASFAGLLAGHGFPIFSLGGK